MLNRVELIIIGVNILDLNTMSVVVDSKGQLPTKEITEETIEQSRDSLFKVIVGLSPEWANPRLLDAFKVGEDGIVVVYTCTIPVDIKLLNEYKFIPLGDVKPSSFGEHNYTLVFKAMERR